jgi:hypothetical protein
MSPRSHFPRPRLNLLQFPVIRIPAFHLLNRYRDHFPSLGCPFIRTHLIADVAANLKGKVPKPMAQKIMLTLAGELAVSLLRGPS